MIWARWAQGQRRLVYSVTTAERINQSSTSFGDDIGSCTFGSDAIAGICPIGDMMAICRHVAVS